MRKIRNWLLDEKRNALAWLNKAKVLLHLSDSSMPAYTTEIPSYFDDLFSADGELRAIEVAFLQRLLTALEHPCAEALQKGRSSQEASVTATLEKMQSQVFKILAQELERAEPAKKGFERFRGKHDSEGPW